MQTKRNLFASCAMPIVLAVGATPAFAADAPPSAAAPAASAGIGDIIVTATRRAEKMQNVPVTVEALGAEQLTQRGVTDLNHLLAELPDIHAGGRGPGQDTLTIRGLSLAQISLQATAVAGPDANVALYVDDASVQMPGRNLDVYVTDLARVEVLEGPQGTLFGASAEGGAIRYITNKPVLDKLQANLSLAGATTPGHAMSGKVSGTINIPIVKDQLAIRVTGFYDRQGGYIDNVPGTFQMPLTGYNADGSVAFQLPANSVRPVIDNAAYVKKDFNPATYSGARAAIKWQPAPDWNVTVEDMYQKLDAEGTFQYDPTLGDLKVQRYGPDYNKDSFNLVEWNVEGKIGDLSLVYDGSYIHRQVHQQFDYTQYAAVGPYAPYYICAYPGYATCATPRMHYIDNTRSTRFSQEFRISTPASKPFRLQAGAYYDNAKVYADDVWFYEGAAAQGFNGQPAGGSEVITNYIRPNGGVYFNDGLRGESQFALFGEASLDITKQLSLTGGARWYNQETELRGSVNCGLRGPTLPNGHVCGSGNYAQSLAGISPHHEKGVKPKVTLSYKPENGLLFYATYSEGFRPGGFNRRGGPANGGFSIPFTYSSDGLKNYEIGWKTQFAHNTIRWNGSAFWMDWSNIPIAIYAPKISNSTFVLNGPNARVKGFSSDLIWRATPEFTITGNLAYNDSQLVSYASIPAAFQAIPGDPNPHSLTMLPLGSSLALAPKWQGGLRGRYEHRLDSGMKLFGQLGGEFVGKSHTSTIKAADFALPGYAMFDGSLGAKGESWSAELYVENLTDKRPVTYVSNGDNINLNSTIRPRTIGIRFNWNFSQE